MKIEHSYISQLQEVKEREDRVEQEINKSDSCECQVFLGNNLLNELQVMSMCVRVLCVSVCVVVADAAAVVLIVLVVVALHLKCGLCDCGAATTTINNIINTQEHKVLRKFLSYSQPVPASE